MRAVVNVEEIQGRTCLVVTELPYQVNPDNLAIKIADLVKDGKIAGIADIRDETSGRTGQRLVIVLKRDAVAKVVLNNLYKHTQLQENFGANMLAIVDGVPRTLPLDGFITHWVDHQIEVIVRRTQFRLRKAEERAHILRGYLKALDALDEVIALIRRSPTVDEARDGLMDAARHRRAAGRRDPRRCSCAASPRSSARRSSTRHAELETRDRRVQGDPRRARCASARSSATSSPRSSTEFGDDRRTEIMFGFDGDMSIEDLIPEEEMVVTVTRGGYIKRTRSDNYRSQHRGGKGVKGAQLRADDVVEHFFVTTTHHWLLFFTNMGRVYRAKAYEVQEAGRDAKGQHVANLLALQPDEEIAQILDIRDYAAATYLVLATRGGLVKKTRLTEYDTNRSGGIIAINLREGDELVSALLVERAIDLLLVSPQGHVAPLHRDRRGAAPDGPLDLRRHRHALPRRATACSRASVVTDDGFVFVVTEGGYAKRTAVDQYRVQSRGGLGIKVAKLQRGPRRPRGRADRRGGRRGLVVLASGKVVRSAVAEVPAKGRDTMGVVFARFADDDRIIAIAKNSERNLDESGSRRPRTQPMRRPRSKPGKDESVDE